MPLHWHSIDVHGYIFKGQAKLLDSLTGDELIIGPGEKFIVTARTLHTECEADEEVLMILALPEIGSFEKLLEQYLPEQL